LFHTRSLHFKVYSLPLSSVTAVHRQSERNWAYCCRETCGIFSDSDNSRLVSVTNL